MYIELLLILIIVIIIVYLVMMLNKQNDNTKIIVKKKVRFFGVPTQVDNIKPVFKPRFMRKKKHNFRFNPFNNIEKYDNYALKK